MLERDCFRLSRNHAPAFFAHDLFGKPVPTPDQVRGRLFSDHALVLTQRYEGRQPASAASTRMRRCSATCFDAARRQTVTATRPAGLCLPHHDIFPVAPMHRHASANSSDEHAVSESGERGDHASDDPRRVRGDTFHHVIRSGLRLLRNSGSAPQRVARSRIVLLRRPLGAVGRFPAIRKKTPVRVRK